MDKFVNLTAKLCLIIPCCYPLNVCGLGAHELYTETEARQCSENNNCERIKSNFRRHAESWCSGDGGLSHIDPVNLTCQQNGQFCEVTAHIYCKGTTVSRRESWYGCSNCNTPKDRENELKRLTGGFSRAVPALSGNPNWNSLCNSINLKCKRVIDWEGTLQSCESSALDGSRAVLCGN